MSGFGSINPDWRVPARVRALVTTRCGGVSVAPFDSMNLGLHVGDDAQAVSANRALLRDGLPRQPVWLDQVHGATVIDAAGVVAGAESPRADASIARIPGHVCAVMSADCLPVIFCDDAGSVVAAAHAGWRGLAAGVLEATIEKMAVPPDRVIAWLGPAIGPNAFEVGEEVRTIFVDAASLAACAFRPSGATGKWMADLYQLARQRLGAIGVKCVTGGNMCTFSDPGRFYSYRRDGATGRFATMVWMSE